MNPVGNSRRTAFRLAYLASKLLFLTVAITGCTRQIPTAERFSNAGVAPTGEVSADLAEASDFVYRLQARDQIRIRFYNHPELDRDSHIRPDGRISLPMVGDLRAMGKTQNELEMAILEAYEGKLKDAEVYVEVTNAQPLFVFVGGEVGSGGQRISYLPNLTVYQAIVSAGGVTPRGELRTVYVVRDQGTSEPDYLVFDVWGPVQSTITNQYLQPNDMVIVPSSPIADANQFVDQYINKLIPFSKGLNVSYNIENIRD